MRHFTCSFCNQLLFFENSQCIGCGRRLGFAVGPRSVEALDWSADSGADGTESAVYSIHAARGSLTYRLCANTVAHNACNWLVPADRDDRYCASCELTEVLPDLTEDTARAAWLRIETAKRRLLYTLLTLHLPVSNRHDDPVRGLAFRFLESTPQEPVVTGHDSGIITLNIAEADAAFRENQREKLGEAYRTVLGHLRHEIGHYYWTCLIEESDRWLEPVRKRFGDDRLDYAQAIDRHYETGPPPNWQDEFISAYATMHPWEDWAESWAHYLHMVDTLETATCYGLSVHAPTSESTREHVRVWDYDATDFDQLNESWYSLTFVLNSLSRSMGVRDMYPFAVSDAVREKLRLVHEVVRAQHEARSREASRG